MKVISSLDFLGTTPRLTIGGLNSNKTLLGGILSIFVGMLLVAGSAYFLNLLISRMNYSVITADEYKPNTFSNYTNSELAFYLSNKYGEFLEDSERLYTMVGTYFYLKKVDNPDGTTSMKLSVMMVKMEKCNVTKHFKNNLKLWQNEKFITHSYCLPSDQLLNVTQPFGYDNSTWLVFWAQRCMNTTTKKDCYSRDYIDKTLNNVFLLTRFTNYYFDHSIKGDTGVPYIHTDGFGVSSTVYKRFSYNMKIVQYDTDAGIFLPDTDSNFYTTMADQKESTDLRTDTTIPNSFAAVSFNMYILKQNITKRYYKFQNMLADMGGLLKGVISIAIFLNWYFCNKQFYNEIINANINSLHKEDIFSKSNSNLKIKNNKNAENFKSIEFIQSQTLNNIPKAANISYSKPPNSPIINYNNLSHNKLDVAQNYEQKEYEMSPSNEKTKLNKKRNGNGRVTVNLKDASLNNKSLIEKNLKREKFTMTFSEYILPICCFPKYTRGYKKIKFHYKQRESVSQQLDILNIIPKLYSVDKLSYLFAGEDYMRAIPLVTNPFFYQEGKIPQTSNITELRKIILKSISSTI
jgi:hypothetical protein